MSWHFLHLGKLVDEDGYIRERAEHRFIARSEGFPLAVTNILSRRDPVPPLGKIDWDLGTPHRAAFVQTVLRLAGQDHTLRVIEHDAHEGPDGRLGRNYVKRTYLLQPAAEWQPVDALLPVRLVDSPPAFEEVCTVPPWTPSGRPPTAKVLPRDIERVRQGDFTLSGTLDARRVRRINSLLAHLSPAEAATTTIDLSAEPGKAAIRWEA